MHPRLLEELLPFARDDARLDRLAFALKNERHRGTGWAERPDLAEKIREAGHVLSRDRGDEVAGLQPGPVGGRARIAADDEHLAVEIGGEEPEPGMRRAVWAAARKHVAENRLQEVDRHHHVELPVLRPLSLLLDLQRADAEEVALRVD